MTINNIINNLYSISIDGKFNGERFTKTGFSNAVKNHWIYNNGELISKELYLEISLADGDWLMKIFQYRDSNDGWDYYIPNTKEEEKKLYDELLKNDHYSD